MTVLTSSGSRPRHGRDLLIVGVRRRVAALMSKMQSGAQQQLQFAVRRNEVGSRQRLCRIGPVLHRPAPQIAITLPEFVGILLAGLLFIGMSIHTRPYQAQAEKNGGALWQLLRPVYAAQSQGVVGRMLIAA